MTIRDYNYFKDDFQVHHSILLGRQRHFEGQSEIVHKFLIPFISLDRMSSFRNLPNIIDGEEKRRYYLETGIRDYVR